MMLNEKAETDENESAQEIVIIRNMPDELNPDSPETVHKTSFKLLKSEYFTLFATVFIVFASAVFFTYSAFFKDSSEELKLVAPEEEFNYALQIDLNNADPVMFELLPGIGPKIAQRIMDYREKNDGFKTVEELEEIKGISLRMVNTLRPFVFIEQIENHDE